MEDRHWFLSRGAHHNIMASQDGERDTKRLRSSEPDLKVVLGGGDGEEAAVTKWHHATTLASRSKYIDAMLAAPMKEQEESTISFPDIDGSLWDDMMKFLDSPAAARRMKAEDALRVAKHYDKYEFTDGSILCDQVLGDYFQETKQMEESLTLDVDLIVESIIVAHEANLMDTLKRGLKYCWDKFHEDAEGPISVTKGPFTRTMFTEDHLKKLAPIMSSTFTQESRKSIGAGAGFDWFQGFLYPFCNTIHPLELELDDPSFPRLFVSKTTQRSEGSLLLQCIKAIELSDAGQSDGVYEKTTRRLTYKRRGRSSWGAGVNTVIFSNELSSMYFEFPRGVSCLVPLFPLWSDWY